MNVREQDIRDITGEVWTTVLGANLPAPASDTEHRLSGTILTSGVQICGAWRGAVTIQCSFDLARTTAGAMFDIDAPRAARERLSA